MSEMTREPGLYWVRRHGCAEWEPARFNGFYWWRLDRFVRRDCDTGERESAFAAIGDRIPSQQEVRDLRARLAAKCEHPNASQCVRLWQDDLNRRQLAAVDPALAEEFPWGCHTVKYLAEALVGSRSEVERLEAENAELKASQTDAAAVTEEFPWGSMSFAGGSARGICAKHMVPLIHTITGDVLCAVCLAAELSQLKSQPRQPTLEDVLVAAARSDLNQSLWNVHLSASRGGSWNLHSGPTFDATIAEGENIHTAAVDILDAIQPAPKPTEPTQVELARAAWTGIYGSVEELNESQMEDRRSRGLALLAAVEALEEKEKGGKDG